MKADVILLAAGSGSRFGGRLEKQFLLLAGAPLFVRSCRVFSSLRFISRIVIAAPWQKVKTVKKVITDDRLLNKVSVVAGGRFRGESVKNALLSLGALSDVVLIHDAARPLVTKKIIKDVYQAAIDNGVSLAAWPLADTLKLADQDERVKKTIPRDRLWCAQTPQGFRREIAQKVLLAPSLHATDDVSLAERQGFKVTLVKASPLNLKVTYPLDLKMASSLQTL